MAPPKDIINVLLPGYSVPFVQFPSSRPSTEASADGGVVSAPPAPCSILSTAVSVLLSTMLASRLPASPLSAPPEPTAPPPELRPPTPLLGRPAPVSAPPLPLVGAVLLPHPMIASAARTEHTKSPFVNPRTIAPTYVSLD